MSLVDRMPALFAFSPEALEASLHAIAALTGLQVCQVPTLLAADPSLLLQPDRLKVNLRGLAAALGVSGSEVAAMGGREPTVLALQGAQVAARLAELQSSFRASRERAVKAVLEAPGLLVAEQGATEAQLQALESAAHTDRELLAPIILARPSLLATPPDIFAQRVSHLARKARVPAEQVLRNSPQGPNLLAASSCFIDRHCRELASTLGPQGCGTHATGPDGECVVACMLVHQPQLVSQHVGAVASKWQLVGALVHGHAGWAEQLAGCGPADRAWLLCLPYMTVARLRFLADYGLQGEVGLLDATRVSDALFHTQYPAFREWLRN